MRVPHVGVVGAGLAGLSAALAATEAGARVTIYERDHVPTGATRDSAGWLWRYDTIARARTCAPHGDPAVQAAIIDQLDVHLQWLQQHGVTLHAASTGRAITRGARIDPRQACAQLEQAVVGSGRATLLTGRAVQRLEREASGMFTLETTDGARAHDAIVLAGGGYGRDLARIARESGTSEAAASQWLLRARSGGDGTTLELGMQLGGVREDPDGESLVRLVVALPESDVIDPELLVQVSELQLPEAVLLDETGHAVTAAAHDWSGAQRAWQLARTTGRGLLAIPPDVLQQRLHCGLTVQEVITRAERAGARMQAQADGGWHVPVVAGITHTRCGLRVDAAGRLLDGDGLTIAGGYAAGADAAEWGRGGAGSGLAQALVLGRSAGTAAVVDREVVATSS